MRILIVNYELPPIGGGGGKACLNLLEEYAKASDLEFDVLTSFHKPGINIEKFSDNIKIYRIGVRKKKLHYWRKIEVLEWLWKANRYYKKMIRLKKYDLIHAFFGFPSGWLCYKSRNQIPYIISLRGSDVPGLNSRLAIDYKILGPLFKNIWKNSCATITCSNGLKERALQFLPNVKIDVIPNGIDTNIFSPNDSKYSDTLNLITVGRLSETKRVDVLVNAVEIIKSKGISVRMVIVGDGATREHLDKLIALKKLDEHIKITGFIESEKMPEYYKNSTLYVSATMQEGMSNAMLEAMASGLPIITTKCEGLDELIEGNGIIIDNAKPSTIADTILQLFEDKDRLSIMSEKSRQIAEKMNWSEIAAEYLDKYFECVK